MESKELKISAENALTAYKNADNNGKKLLENLFGKEVFAPKNVMERVKTYEDACEVLGISPVLNCPNLCICEKHEETFEMNEHFSFRQALDKHTLAYLKLCVIIDALNEGWKPKFTKDERRCYPWFYIYTQEEIDKMSEEDKTRLWIVGGHSDNGAACGLASSTSDFAFSLSPAYVSARLALKSSELAKYCGKQFIEIWSDYLFK